VDSCTSGVKCRIAVGLAWHSNGSGNTSHYLKTAGMWCWPPSSTVGLNTVLFGQLTSLLRLFCMTECSAVLSAIAVCYKSRSMHFSSNYCSWCRFLIVLIIWRRFGTCYFGVWHVLILKLDIPLFSCIIS
jgi:hypothetical protein